jgi:excisionase family DNA binding protein
VETELDTDNGKHGRTITELGLQLLTPEEVADRLRISRAKVFELFHEGLPSLRIGRCRRVDVERLREWLAAQEHLPR